MRHAVIAILACGWAAASAPGQAPEKVHASAAPEVVEQALGDLSISYKKTTGDKPGILYYDFERDGSKVRLTNFSGKDLWLSVIFPRTSLDAVNNWNQRAKFSRAVQFLEKDAERISLESQIDCAPGVTGGAIRQFVRRFDVELKMYAKTQENGN